MYDHYLVFDVESIGLHGEGFAFGYVVINSKGEKLEEGIRSCPSDVAQGTSSNRHWVLNNIKPLPITDRSTKAVREAFWSVWMKWKDKKTALIADCAWPVEARFLMACVDDRSADREWLGPYPLHELASFLVAAGKDPLAVTNRLPEELPAHNPLNDARQSARQLTEVLNVLLS